MHALMLDIRVPPIMVYKPFVFVGGSWNVQFRVAQVAYPGRESKSEHVHQREHVVGEAGRVRVVLLDAQNRLVVKHPVEHIGRIAHADVDDFGTERRVRIRNMGVDHLPRFGAVLRIDVAGAFGPASGAEALTIRRRGVAVAPVRGERVAPYRAIFSVSLLPQKRRNDRNGRRK